MKLYNIAKSLILEVASIESVIDAIRNKNRIVIYYDGDEPGGKGLREIEPVCFGYSKAGNAVLRAWDIEGASHRGLLGTRPIPGWRLFRLDKVLSFSKTGDKFSTPRPNYNPNGDKTMKTVIINVKFDENI
jgi:predicted DNA-binding transcriptional regulator YafY